MWQWSLCHGMLVKTAGRGSGLRLSPALSENQECELENNSGLENPGVPIWAL